MFGFLDFIGNVITEVVTAPALKFLNLCLVA